MDEKWRDTYPYVPTSYLPTTQNAPDRSNIGTSRSRSGRGDTRLVFLRHMKSEMLDSPSNKAPAIFVSFLLTEITTVMILGSFPYHGRTL